MLRCKRNAVVKVKVHLPWMIIIRETSAAIQLAKKMKRKQDKEREGDTIQGSLTRQKRRGALRCIFHGIDLIDSPRRRLATTQWRSGGDAWWWWRTSPRESIDLRQGFPSLGTEVGSRGGEGEKCSVGREGAGERMTIGIETNMRESYLKKSASLKLSSLVLTECDFDSNRSVYDYLGARECCYLVICARLVCFHNLVARVYSFRNIDFYTTAFILMYLSEQYHERGNVATLETEMVQTFDCIYLSES